MNRKTELLALAACMAFGANALAARLPKPQPMTKAIYQAEQAKIDAQYKADRKLCDTFHGQKQKIGAGEARGRQAARKAELEARYRPSPEASKKAKSITAEANYDVAKAKCEAVKDKARDRCIKEVKAAREAAIRQAKVEKVQETGGPFASGSAHRVI